MQICRANSNFLNEFTVPPKLNPLHSSISQNMGDRASITCSVIKGDLPLSIKWLKDGNIIDPSQRISVTQVDQYNSILVIEQLQEFHSANYSCLVSNQAAEVESTQALLVNGKPFRKMRNVQGFFVCSVMS